MSFKMSCGVYEGRQVCQHSCSFLFLCCSSVVVEKKTGWGDFPETKTLIFNYQSA